MALNTKDGTKIYTPLSLKLYDWWVLEISNRYAWRCNTHRFLLSHFKKNIRANHLDIGVGTGFYPKMVREQINQISFVDLNPHSLSYARKSIGDNKIKQCVLHDIFNPLPKDMNGTFDSISLFYLLHCLPGTMQDKKTAIQHIAAALKPDGVLYGATILGKGIQHNTFGRKLMQVYNKKGIFSNYHDSSESLQEALSAFFVDVNIQVEGVVAIFSAKNKI
ncbi:Methylase involved in ubiquinone/menaquinone biosynthesis [Pasteurella testudinis DSM 23072]|uniref:Methylase involved in ubiquinone/menaquinone biosynthesis n=1 Tax=Pasteurella testudinis DSM 23072 TaxID=1122938 RepID=A0A1W1UYT7_9PAST|nr:class I SAM-dependent methyltransferase [Pasteurella testudinis]SMB86226.1 Methylase involved in ubiquinone/menaquinone biosynthesis [Pasteurella testudinis DSM 23072]SUB51753.1 putative methyltransferase [Pasteurella testudinis]